MKSQTNALAGGAFVFYFPEQYLDALAMEHTDLLNMNEQMQITQKLLDLPLYKDAEFFIFDEPTASLDPRAEYELFCKYKKMVEGKTAVFISHRMSSCRFSDRIIVFDKGKIVQEVSHEELVAVEGKYRRMWQAQAKNFMS